MWEYWQPHPRANVLLALMMLVEFKDPYGRRYAFTAGGRAARYPHQQVLNQRLQVHVLQL